MNTVLSELFDQMADIMEILAQPVLENGRDSAVKIRSWAKSKLKA